MADNRSVTITLKTEKAEDNRTDTSNQTGGVYSASTVTSNDSDATAKAAYAGMAIQAAQIALNEGIAWAEYYWNRDLSLADDYIGQRNKQIITAQINRGISAISTIGSFTAIGAKAGPVGAAIGALLGTAVVTAGIIRSNQQGQDQQNIVMAQINTQLNYTRSRAGWSTHAASIGEDL